MIKGSGGGLGSRPFFMNMKIQILKDIKANKRSVKAGDIMDLKPDEAFYLVSIKAAKHYEESLELAPEMETPIIEQTKKGKKKK